MSSISELADLLTDRVLLLKEKIDKLEQENDKLRREVLQLEQAELRAKEETAEVKGENEALKVANRILGSKDHKKETKLKINSLIREIDACIVQLSKEGFYEQRAIKDKTCCR